VPAILADRFTTSAAYLSHMLAVLADRFAAFAPGFGMPLRVAMPPLAFPVTLTAAASLPALIVVVLVALAPGARMLFARAAALTVGHCLFLSGAF